VTEVRAIGTDAATSASSVGLPSSTGPTMRSNTIGAAAFGKKYQSLMPMIWFIRAAARGSTGVSAGAGNRASR
jgi:hypothetical protein